MSGRGTLGLASWLGTSAGVLALAGVLGCAMVPPNSLLDPTKVGRFGLDAYEGGIREVLSPLETPPGIARAEEPVPEDLVPVFEEYRIAVGDLMSVTINDLIQPGVQYAAVVQVNALGEIRIPLLGTVKVTGLTEGEVEQELTARLIEAELLPNPIVIVFIQSKRGLQFSVMGGVPRPGPYPITEPDLRLLEALAMVGDSSPGLEKAYVIRKQAESGGGGPELEALPPPESEDRWIIPPPESGGAEAAPASFLATAGRGQDEPPVTQPATEDVTREELAEVFAPRTQPAVRTESDAAFPQLIFDPVTGEMIRSEREERPAEGEAPVAQGPDDIDRMLAEPFDWDNVEDYTLEQRVIAIDLKQLKSGDPRQNIVVRNRDIINVPVDTGVFYMMGEINRPGVYAFGGREITIKQAIAISGGFSPLAWPQRCEIVRPQPGTDKQLMIPVNLDLVFAGRADDFYLRDGDIVNVGTHIIAPFLFVIRNSFRFTYGFGFVYDRNFADKDAYGSKPNPVFTEQARSQRRGLPF